MDLIRFPEDTPIRVKSATGKLGTLLAIERAGVAKPAWNAFVRWDHSGKSYRPLAGLEIVEGM